MGKLKPVCCMRRKLCLGCSLARFRTLPSSPYWNFVVLLCSFACCQEILVELASCLRYHASLISFPLHADAYPWQSFVCSFFPLLSHIHIHDEVWVFLPVSWTYKPSCAPSLLEQHRGGCSFPLPNQLQIFSTHPFHSYFWTKHPHLLFPLQS